MREAPVLLTRACLARVHSRVHSRGRRAARLVLPAVLLALLAACSDAQAPRAAEFIPPPESTAAFGDLRIHYNALPTMALSVPVAKEYQVTRDEDTALIVVALRRDVAGDEQPVAGTASLEASDLSGQRQRITLREVRTGDYVDHVGVARVNAHDTLRFALVATVDGRTHPVAFERTF